MIRTALALALVSAALPQDARKPGAAIVIGGGADQPAIVKRVIELSGGPDARILVLPISTSVKESPGQSMADCFRENGAKNVGIWAPNRYEWVVTQYAPQAMTPITARAIPPNSAARARSPRSRRRARFRDAQNEGSRRYGNG